MRKSMNKYRSHRKMPFMDGRSSGRPEMVDFGSGQSRSAWETASVAALRRGFPKSENAGRVRKMPFMDGH
jgi:hypothetical protein